MDISVRIKVKGKKYEALYKSTAGTDFYCIETEYTDNEYYIYKHSRLSDEEVLEYLGVFSGDDLNDIDYLKRLEVKEKIYNYDLDIDF